ncbi:trna (adenine-n)-methyltransferase non-catalytic subunit trm6-like [Stylonychia lemnae]|uniref:tRNA (adenine(58)-N(1))-methyltransferase non-catalytic subunit TRM6 n=1 Tax=Stylonychia lemnae TaxID=5949 RepID=A0A078B888_STYLE|nr:trna (adenine-n)-methyltransferase non-catalytic subunit trm6-like [Stylonychia lemnae]|eukprot:CDW89783.1 trna (adenine-n)-methyltransferase non-catalytic subunit trm6-like [Stylonychia lemnae]
MLRKIKHFKAMVDLGQLIGKEYGQFFEVRDSKSGELIEVTDVHQLTNQFLEDVDFGDAEENEEVKEIIDPVAGRDNRDYVDDNKSQKLSHEEIEALKKQGMSGNELIQQLVQNSETFSKRTKFSQEKYLRKKKQKYQITFQLKKPTALELCNVYSQTQPAKIMGLRADSLALLLNMANINQESRVILLDKTKGLLTGALIEKDVREILHVEFTGHQLKLQNEIFLEYNYKPDKVKRIQYLHHTNLDQSIVQSDSLLNAIIQTKTKHYNSMIMVHEDFNQVEMYNHIEHLIQPSASIAVFSLYIQSLAELKDHLLTNKKAVNIKIEELWTREYQVLPMRTHPNMNMHGASGFILSAVKVE